MHFEILLGVALMVATTMVHTLCTGLSLRLLRSLRAAHWMLESGLKQALVIASVVVTLFLTSIIESAMWAATYVGLGAIDSFKDALYFSTVTYTTLGFGDITLGEDWRLLSAFEAANGTIMFGWSTALVFAFVQHIIKLNYSQNENKD